MNIMYDVNVNDYCRMEGEKGDSARITRALKGLERGVLYFPKGVYEIDEPILVDNACSLLLHPSAVLKAVREMDFVVRYDAAATYPGLVEENFRLIPNEDPDSEYWNAFISGGIIDGAGLASCLVINNFKHFTLRDMSIRNGKHYGLYTKEKGTRWTFEMVAQNLYCKCTMPGLAGNIGICLNDGDCHFIDCIVIDYTIAFDIREPAGSTRLTRCHVWGGPIRARKAGELPEMLENSVNFRINAHDTLLTDCYADTGLVGFEINEMTRLIGCSYYNNYDYEMDNVTVIKHNSGQLMVSNCLFRQHSPHAVLYESSDHVGKDDLIWRDNYLEGGLHLPENI